MHNLPNTVVPLLSTTGVAAIDKVLGSLIRRFEDHFPQRIRGYYLEGSYVDGTAVPTSDIDLRIVFRDQLDQQAKEQCNLLGAACARTSPIPLDLKAESEAALFRVGAVRFQQATLLMYGEDIRPDIPIKPLGEYIRDTIHGVFPILARTRGNPPALTYPLDYPDPSGFLYGYDRRTIQLQDRTLHASIKDLAVHVLSPATARIAAEAQVYVITKRDCVPLYQARINDQWASLVERVDTWCRTRWSYLVPSSPAEQEHVRALCQEALAFQNDFLARYKRYLLAELRHTNLAFRLFAAQRLGRMVYRDPAVVAALQDIAACDELEVQQAANVTLQQYM